MPDGTFRNSQAGPMLNDDLPSEILLVAPVASIDAVATLSRAGTLRPLPTPFQPAALARSAGTCHVVHFATPAAARRISADLARHSDLSPQIIDLSDRARLYLETRGQHPHEPFDLVTFARLCGRERRQIRQAGACPVACLRLLSDVYRLRLSPVREADRADLAGEMREITTPSTRLALTGGLRTRKGPWSPLEVRIALTRQEAGQDIDAIARALARSTAAVRARLALEKSRHRAAGQAAPVPHPDFAPDTGQRSRRPHAVVCTDAPAMKGRPDAP